MRIVFPFDIAQVTDNSVEIKLNLHGEPLVSIDVHPTLRKFITDDAMDDMYKKVIEVAISACVKIEP